jgi:hypothetical protein
LHLVFIIIKVIHELYLQMILLAKQVKMLLHYKNKDLYLLA